MVERSSSEYKKWVRDVKGKYKSCVFCKNKENLHAHHILKFEHFKEHRIDIKNALTVCEKCHKLIHSTGGKFGREIIKF